GGVPNGTPASPAFCLLFRNNY
ncbi:uncharacterized protein METZ01_LOCUS218198, partial [marine metagenome]